MHNAIKEYGNIIPIKAHEKNGKVTKKGNKWESFI
jgi:hypothetical protein